MQKHWNKGQDKPEPNHQKAVLIDTIFYLDPQFNKTRIKSKNREDDFKQQNRRSQKQIINQRSLRRTASKKEQLQTSIKKSQNQIKVSEQKRKPRKSPSMMGSVESKKSRKPRKGFENDPTQRKMTDYFTKRDGQELNFLEQTKKSLIKQNEASSPRFKRQTSFSFEDNQFKEKSKQCQMAEQRKFSKSTMKNSVYNLKQIQEQVDMQHEQSKRAHSEQHKQQYKSSNQILLKYNNNFKNQNSIQRERQKQNTSINKISNQNLMQNQNSLASKKQLNSLNLQYSSTKMTYEPRQNNQFVQTALKTKHSEIVQPPIDQQAQQRNRIVKLFNKNKRAILQKIIKQEKIKQKINQLAPRMRQGAVHQRATFQTYCGQIKYVDGKVTFTQSQIFKKAKKKHQQYKQDERFIGSSLFRYSQYIHARCDLEIKQHFSVQQKHKIHQKEYEQDKYNYYLLCIEKQIKTKQARQISHQKSCKLQGLNWKVNEYLHPLLLIGTGCFSEVYSCYDSRAFKKFALKISFSRSSEEEVKKKHLEYMHREYETQVKLDHPNVVKVYQKVQFEDKNLFAVKQELCEGPELGEYLSIFKFLRQEQAKNIVRQVLFGLNYLHSKNIIHYDIKLKNLIFHEQHIKILDFGLCKQIQESQQDTELTTSGIGTLYYQPPETAESHNLISTKVDIFSLGVVFYELLYGCRPFGSKKTQEKAAEIIRNEKTCKVVFPEKHSNQVSKEAQMFISRCLNFDPSNRYTARQALKSEYMRILREDI